MADQTADQKKASQQAEERREAEAKREQTRAESQAKALVEERRRRDERALDEAKAVAAAQAKAPTNLDRQAGHAGTLPAWETSPEGKAYLAAAKGKRVSADPDVPSPAEGGVTPRNG